MKNAKKVRLLSGFKKLGRVARLIPLLLIAIRFFILLLLNRNVEHFFFESGKNLLSKTQVGVLGKCQGIDCLVYEMLLIKRVPNSSFNLYHILDIF